MKAVLAVQEVELKIKNDAADALIEIVGVETEKVCKEKASGKFNSKLKLVFVDCFTDSLYIDKNYS